MVRRDAAPRVRRSATSPTGSDGALRLRPPAQRTPPRRASSSRWRGSAPSRTKSPPRPAASSSSARTRSTKCSDGSKAASELARGWPGGRFARPSPPLSRRAPSTAGRAVTGDMRTEPHSNPRRRSNAPGCIEANLEAGVVRHRRGEPPPRPRRLRQHRQEPAAPRRALLRPARNCNASARCSTTTGANAKLISRMSGREHR